MEYRFEQGNFADARIVRTRVFMRSRASRTSSTASMRTRPPST